MEIITDLEVHSRYSRAVSPKMTLPTIAEWAKKKGIGLVGTGDFTHPLWFRELKAGLEETKKGIFKLKGTKQKTRFLLTSEVSCIYTDKDKGRRVHFFIYLPSFSKIRQFNKKLTQNGANLLSDGRPMMGLTLAQVAEIALSVDPKAILIPAHVWTPWYGFYGSKSGYDSLIEAFGDLEKYIPAIETGLSSDPAMNWRIEELADRRIVSFSDAHSPQKMGREATVFEVPELNYENIRKAITSEAQDARIAYTIEFYPEEGKYHYTGHRKCNIVYSPKEARKKGTICPVCGRPLTVGVMSRVESLAAFDVETESTKDKHGVRWVKDKEGSRPPYVMLVPLLEILSEALSVGVGSQKVLGLYDQLTYSLGSEFDILLKTDLAEIGRIAGGKVADGISKVRAGDIVIKPGYDGVFGKVGLWKEEEEKEQKNIDQTSLF